MIRRKICRSCEGRKANEGEDLKNRCDIENKARNHNLFGTQTSDL